MRNEWKGMLLWGYHPSYCDEPIKICESPTKKQYAERESQGWLLSVEIPGAEMAGFLQMVGNAKKSHAQTRGSRA